MRLLAIIVLVLALKNSQCLRIKQTHIGRLDISRFPHFEELEKNMKKRSGYIDISRYTAGLEDTRISEHLTDLPDELQQLQQQLLEVSQQLCRDLVLVDSDSILRYRAYMIIK